MKIAFIQNRCVENAGIMSLAALLKVNGFSVQVFVNNCEKDIVKSVRNFSPQLACFSCVTGEHIWALKTAGKIKKNSGVFTVFGGPHPTFAPQILDYAQVDAVCIGEAELSLLELANSLKKGALKTDIKGIYFKEYGKTIRNQLERPLENLDLLPFPDRNIYDKYQVMRDMPTRIFLASRGCFFDCSYCLAPSLRKLYGQNKPVLFKSINYLIAELNEAGKKNKIKHVFFKDDAFLYDQKWIFNFLERYANEIRMPFFCDMPIPLKDRRLFSLLKQAGCRRITLSIGCADEHLRKTVLGKNFSNSDLMETARLIREQKMEIFCDNLMGLPGETLKDGLKTIGLNAQIKPDCLLCSILQPYPGTEIEKLALEQNLLKKGDSDYFSATYFKSSPLSQPCIKQLVRLQKFFFLGVRAPFLIPAIKFLVYLPLDFLYHFIFVVSFAFQYKKLNKLTFGQLFRFGLRSLPVYAK